MRCQSRTARWARRAQQETQGVRRVAGFPLHLNRRVRTEAAHHKAEHVRSSIVESPKSGSEPDARESWVSVDGRPRHVVRAQTAAVDASIRGRDARERVSADGDVLGCVPAVIGDFERDCRRLRTTGHVTQVLNDEAGTLLRAARRRR